MRRRLFTIAAALSVILLVGIAISLLQSHRTARRLEFVFPSGNREPFLIIEDKRAPALMSENGTIVLSVPDSGLISVNSVSSLADHEYTIVGILADGEVCPFDDGSGQVRSDQVAIRGFRFLRENTAGRNVESYEFWLGTAHEDNPTEFMQMRIEATAQPTTQSN